MSIRITDQTAIVKKIVEQTDKYAVVHLTTSRKRTDFEKNKRLIDAEKNAFLLKDWAYSDWGFVKLVGKASVYLLENVQEKDLIVIKSGTISFEQYEDKEGEVVRPKNPQYLVFEIELKNASTSKSVTLPDENDLPF